MSNYLSCVYDLTQFGIHKINSALLTADLDRGITVEVSFDGGASFSSAPLNTRFTVVNSSGKIQTRIVFKSVEQSDIYQVRTTGFFNNLSIGTRVTFTHLTTQKEYSTTLGDHGKYMLMLPRGQYRIWYMSGKNQITITESFDPEMIIDPTHRTDKEVAIELFFRDVPWAKSCVFDTFDDPKKMLYGSAIRDVDGDLSDGTTSRKVKYWAVAFD